jgi:hypothetical protein
MNMFWGDSWRIGIADFYNLKNSVSSPTSANIRKKRATNSLFGNVSVVGRA